MTRCSTVEPASEYAQRQRSLLYRFLGSRIATLAVFDDSDLSDCGPSLLDVWKRLNLSLDLFSLATGSNRQVVVCL
jgi:hypothetical protein